MKNKERQLLNQNQNKIERPNIFNSSNNDNSNIFNKNNVNQNNLLNNYNNIDKNLYNEKNIVKNKINYIDERLELTFKYLDIEKLLSIFINNNITFNDLLTLSRKDLIDLGVPMLERNRILYFSQQFIKIAKSYSLEEITSFFQKNRNLYDKNLLNNSNNLSNYKNIYSEYYSQYNNNYNNKTKTKIDDKQLYASNGFNGLENFNTNNYNNIDKEKDSQQELDYCNIYQGGISHSRTNTSSKNNANSSCNKIDFFKNYRELTQEVDNYMNKFKEYKQSWLDSKNKYDNLMNSYLVRGKTVINKNNRNNNKKNNSNNKLGKNISKIDRESFEKLKLLKQRKEELKRRLGKITDKSNHKKMIIKYLEEN